MYFQQIACSFFLLLAAGCEQIVEEKIEACNPPSIIVSTQEIKFFLLEGRKYIDIGSKEISRDNRVLCLEIKKIASGASCSQGTPNEIASEINVGSRFAMDGTIIKTHRKGLAAIDGGPTPLAFMRGVLFEEGSVPVTAWLRADNLLYLALLKELIVLDPLNLDTHITLDLGSKIKSTKFFYSKKENDFKFSYDLMLDRSEFYNNWLCVNKKRIEHERFIFFLESIPIISSTYFWFECACRRNLWRSKYRCRYFLY